jgi:hypothetical protein
MVNKWLRAKDCKRFSKPKVKIVYLLYKLKEGCECPKIHNSGEGFMCDINFALYHGE